jgi:hypothetical protein
MKAMATKKQFINEAAPALILKANNRFEIVDNHVATPSDYNNSYSVKYMRLYNALKGIK